MPQWHCRVGEQTYGPMDEEALRLWVREGRVAPSDPVWTEGMPQWLPLRQVPRLASAGPLLPPFPQAPQAYAQPHRGSAVLVFGILGLVMCMLFGIAAWVMGNTDLQKMKVGQMDPSGRSMTNAGRICGMISVILGCAAIAFYVILFCLAA